MNRVLPTWRRAASASTRLVTLILAAIVLILGTACDAPRGRQEAVAAAAYKTPRLNTFRFEMIQEITLPDLLSVEYEMKGQYSYPDRVWTEITTHVGPDVKTNFTIFRFGKGYYLRIPDETRILLPGTNEWLAGKTDELERSRFLGLLPKEAQDITETLSFLNDASSYIEARDHTILEKKAINYVTHYEFQLDPEKLANSAALGRHGFFASGGAEVWVGLDDLIREVHIVLLGPARAGGAARVDINLVLTDQNAELTFRAPRQEKVTPFDEFSARYPNTASGNVKF